jgi:hypothetical protein
MSSVCPINEAKLQVRLSSLLASVPSITRMAVSVRRLTIVLGLLVLILTCHAGKSFSSQSMDCAIASSDCRKVGTDPKHKKGERTERLRKSIGLGNLKIKALTFLGII